MGRYAYNFVIGMQGGEDPRYYKAVADCKHYAAYDLDHWQGEDRTAFSANVSQQELIEYFLPGFERCIRDARAGSIMCRSHTPPLIVPTHCLLAHSSPPPQQPLRPPPRTAHSLPPLYLLCSYNALNEIPTCADDFLIQTVARELWEYDTLPDGWVVSDCDAVANIWDPHHYTKTPQAAAAAGLLAGTDLDCGGFYRDHLPAAMSEGLITEADLDRSVLRLTRSLLRIGYWDDPKQQPYRQYGIEHVNSEESNSVSYLAALESLTLLKNSKGALPIDASSGVTIALIGPLANDTYFVQGNYRGKPPYVTTTLDAFMAESNVKVTYVQGCAVDSRDTSGFDAAVAAAKAADYTIYVGGLTEQQESEGHDRTVLTWPGVQQQLITQLAAATKKPLIVLVMGGGQIDLSTEKAADNVGALMWIGYPSMHGGRAIATALLGRYSPSGRLVTTQYPASYVSLSMEDMELRPNAATRNPGRTYLWYTGTPVYPFGFGLSYTTFSYKFFDTARPVESTREWSRRTVEWAITNQVKDQSSAPFLTYSCNVTNTGAVQSDVSVLLFMNSTVPDTPRQTLVGYVHVHGLAAGATQTVYFDVDMSRVLYADAQGDRWLMPGDYRFFIGHAGHAEHEHTFIMEGEAALIQQWPRRDGQHTSPISPAAPTTQQVSAE